MVGFMAAMDREIAVPYAIEAGCDMILFNKVYEEDIQFMKDGFKKGILSEKRLDEAVLRILATKASMKLHVKQRENKLIPNIESLNDIGNNKHQSWADICSDEAITLVKDTQNLLPIQHKKHKHILLEYLGEESKKNHILQLIKNRLEKDGYHITIYEKEHFDFSKPFKFESVTEFRNKYDLVIYLSNVENASNKTTNRINWHAPYGAGNNIPWFVEVVPTLFISLQNPYHLLDVPMIKTYINAYSYHDSIINNLLEKILGNSPFKGVNPIDPFCGKEYLKY
jgi:beta-N-acetylhexosaminidase